MSRNDFVQLLPRMLTDLGKRATVVQVCKYIWQHYEQQLRDSGDFFYTWQYDVRWAADTLRKRGLIKLARNRTWELI